jgi:hypothetical protein
MKIADTTVAIRRPGKMEKFFLLVYNHVSNGKTVFVTGLSQELANFTVKRVGRLGIPCEYHSTFNESNMPGYKFSLKQLELCQS